MAKIDNIRDDHSVRLIPNLNRPSEGGRLRKNYCNN